MATLILRAGLVTCMQFPHTDTELVAASTGSEQTCRRSSAGRVRGCEAGVTYKAQPGAVKQII